MSPTLHSWTTIERATTAARNAERNIVSAPLALAQRRCGGDQVARLRRLEADLGEGDELRRNRKLELVAVLDVQVAGRAAQAGVRVLERDPVHRGDDLLRDRIERLEVV